MKIEKFRVVEISATKNIFKVDESYPPENNKVELFQTTVARGLFLCKRSRPNMQTTIEVLCAIVKHTNQGYWNKLLILMKYLVGTE